LHCKKGVLIFTAHGYETKLEMPDAKNTVKIDRAHRLGKYTTAKKRPIVAKFNFYQDKQDIKQRVYERRADLGVNVSDQYPKIIQERRKLLIPELIRAREAGREAVLRYDKLYIDGRLHRPAPETEAARD